MKLVNRHSLWELATSRNPNDPPLGGLSKQKTDEHFAQAFDGSVARTQLALLDPLLHLNRTSNAFISCLAGSNLSLTDAPCGAGAAAFSFLASIAELRARNVLPREPLYVALIGGELSEPALLYATELFSEIKTPLEEQAIFVDAEFRVWDVTCHLKNTDLVSRMIETSKNNSKRLVIMANFNGFLEKEKRWNAAEPQIAELFRYASGKSNVAIWIEPDMNRATKEGGLFTKLRNRLKSTWRSFATEASDPEAEEPLCKSAAQFRNPLDPVKTAKVRLAVIPFDLVRSK